MPKFCLAQKVMNQVQPTKNRCFCAADLTFHPQNQLLLAIRRYWRTGASGGFREDVNRRIAD
ncbi:MULTISPECIES: hypothetical protein [unclassified Microcoleus]|uniref:hypothetical protein n=2 Tax=unclassified Microcoleus TaxID=2642155 RepID=UPI002FD209E4